MAIYKPRERTVTHPSLTASKRIKLCQYLNLGKIPPEKEMATHSSILAWKISWGLQSMGSQRVVHD